MQIDPLAVALVLRNGGYVHGNNRRAFRIWPGSVFDKPGDGSYKSCLGDVLEMSWRFLQAALLNRFFPVKTM